MKTWGLRILVAGVALQVIDVVSGNKVFGSTGFLYAVDSKIPKLTLPIGTGVETNMAFWMIAGGGIAYLAG